MQTTSLSKQEIINYTAAHIEELFSGEGSGHDWWHIYRVWQLAKKLAAQEHADIFVTELAALLHDIADWKFNNGSEDAGPEAAAAWLERLQVNPEIIRKVKTIIKEVSYKGAGVETKGSSPEAQVVQDADRLDAIGAIGIARAFTYGGYKGRHMYDPAVKPELHQTFEAYKNNGGPTINHFYEKLLLLKGRMQTETGKKMAAQRHAFMEQFLEQFYTEWHMDQADFKPFS